LGCWPKEGCKDCILHQRVLGKIGHSCEKEFPECMHSVKPIEVIKAIEKLLEKIGIEKKPLSRRLYIHNDEK